MRANPVIVPISQMRNLSLGKLVGLAKGLMISKQQSWNFSPGSLSNGRMEFK